MRYPNCETVHGLGRVLAEESRKSLYLLLEPLWPAITPPHTSLTNLEFPSYHLASVIQSSMLFSEHTRHTVTSLLSSQNILSWHIWIILFLISSFCSNVTFLNELYLDCPTKMSACILQDAIPFSLLEILFLYHIITLKSLYIFSIMIIIICLSPLAHNVQLLLNVECKARSAI